LGPGYSIWLWILSQYLSALAFFEFKSPGSRYQNGGSTSVLGYSTFRSHVISIVASCLGVWQSVPTRPTHRAARLSAFANLRDFLQTNLPGFGFWKVQHLLMVASPIGLLPLWVSSMASTEYNGRAFTRLCAAYGFAKTDINHPCALKYLSACFAAIGESLSVTKNSICKFGWDTVEMVGKQMVKGQSAVKSIFLDTVFLEQCFYFPDLAGSSLSIYTPGGDSSTLTGVLFKRWIVSHDCPAHFENTTELHQYVPVGKFITDIPLKCQLAGSLPSVNPQPTLHRYSQCNTDFLFQRSPVVSVSKWNALLGKDATSSKESHSDANNEEDDSANNEDGIAMANVVDTTEFPGSDPVPIEDGLAGVSVLRQTVGLVDDLGVRELPTHSTPHSEGGDLNWLDKNEKRDGAFFLYFLDEESECGPSYYTLPVDILLSSRAVSQKRRAYIDRTAGQKSFKLNDYFAMGSFPHVSRSGTEPGYLSPSFSVPSWWLHKVKQKQHYCLNVRTLIPSIHPALSFEIKEYLPWSKRHDIYFVIKEEPGRDLNLMILPPILHGLSVVPGHSFPIFSTKANALFYGRLTILLTNLHSNFFHSHPRVQKEGNESLSPTNSHLHPAH
jgi:hypothetical protein